MTSHPREAATPGGRHPSEFSAKPLGRVLITGAGGMLGNAVYPYFVRRSQKVLATDRVVSEPWIEKLDIRDTAKLHSVFSGFQPDLVLNLAAETDLEYCEENPDIAAAVNGDATKEIASLADSFGCTLVYISTAGVFDGKKGLDALYTERDEPNPIMVYGRTKYDGENHVRGLCERHYVVRAGWMVGGGSRKDHKFVSRILQQLADGWKVVHAVNDRFGTPTYTHDFAMNLFALLDQKAYGTYHMVCEGTGSRYDVAKEIVRICGSGAEVKPVDSDFFREEFPAPRPRSEMLCNERLGELDLNLMRPWRDALRDYIEREYADLCAGAAGA